MYNGYTCRFLRSLARTLAIPPLVVELSLPDLTTCWVCHFWESNTLPSFPHDRQKSTTVGAGLWCTNQYWFSFTKYMTSYSSFGLDFESVRIILYLFKWIDIHKTFLQPTYFWRKKKFNLKVKSLSVINNWYLHLRYLCFLSLNDMKNSNSKPTIRCTLQALLLS